MLQKQKSLFKHQRLLVFVDVVVPWHSTDQKRSIFVCFIINLLLDTAKTTQPSGIWIVRFSADFRRPYLALFQVGLLQWFSGNPSASTGWLPESLLEQPGHQHGAASRRSLPFPKCSNWFSSSLKQCWALSRMFLCGTKSSFLRMDYILTTYYLKISRAVYCSAIYDSLVRVLRIRPLWSMRRNRDK